MHCHRQFEAVGLSKNAEAFAEAKPMATYHAQRSRWFPVHTPPRRT
jgi:hypothetical protein